MVNLAAALTVALPLYQWPLPGAWDQVYNTIEAHPLTNFDIIVNQNSGPGQFPPSPDYTSAVAKLNTYPNVATYGYLKINWAARPLSQTISDVRTYAQWSSYPHADISLAGLFIDEAPWDTADLPYMAELATRIRKIMPPGSARIWTNPGTPVADRFYQYADIVTAFEDTFEFWISGERPGIPDRVHERSSVMLLDYPGSKGGVRGEVEVLTRKRFHSAFLMGYEGYQAFSPTWKKFAREVDGTKL